MAALLPSSGRMRRSRAFVTRGRAIRVDCSLTLNNVVEDVFEAQRRPANRTRFLRESDGFTLDSPAEPIEKLLFCSFDNYRVTADAKGIHDGMTRLEFARKPASPLRHSGQPVYLRNGSPHELMVGASQ